jgi:hypothetical protein
MSYLIRNKIILFSGLDSFLSNELIGGRFTEIKPIFKDLVKKSYNINLINTIFGTTFNEYTIFNNINFTNDTTNVRTIRNSYNVIYCSVEGHAISIVYIKKTEGYTVALCNSGYKCEYHNFVDSNVKGILIFKNKNVDFIRKILSYTRIANLLSHFYELLMLELYKDSPSADHPMKQMFNGKINDFLEVIPQSTGDCSYKALLMGFLFSIYDKTSKHDFKHKKTFINDFIAVNCLSSINEIITTIKSNNVLHEFPIYFYDILRHNTNKFSYLLSRKTTEINEIIEKNKNNLCQIYNDINLPNPINLSKSTDKTNQSHMPQINIGTINDIDRDTLIKNNLTRIYSFIDNSSSENQQVHLHTFIKLVEDCLNDNFLQNAGVIFMFYKELVKQLPVYFLRTMGDLSALTNPERYNCVKRIYNLIFKYRLNYVYNPSTNFALVMIMYNLMTNELNELNGHFANHTDMDHSIPSDFVKLNDSARRKYGFEYVVNSDIGRKVLMEHECLRQYRKSMTNSYTENYDNYHFMCDKASTIRFWYDNENYNLLYILYSCIDAIRQLELQDLYNDGTNSIAISGELFSINTEEEFQSRYEAISTDELDARQISYGGGNGKLPIMTHMLYKVRNFSDNLYDDTHKIDMLHMYLRSIFLCNNSQLILNNLNIDIPFPFCEMYLKHITDRSLDFWQTLLVKRTNTVFPNGLEYSQLYLTSCTPYYSFSQKQDDFNVNSFDSQITLFIDFIKTLNIDYLNNHTISPVIKIGRIDDGDTITDTANITLADNKIRSPYAQILIDQNKTCFVNFINKFNRNEINFDKKINNIIIYFMKIFKNVDGTLPDIIVEPLMLYTENDVENESDVYMKVIKLINIINYGNISLDVIHKLYNNLTYEFTQNVSTDLFVKPVKVVIEPSNELIHSDVNIITIIQMSNSSPFTLNNYENYYLQALIANTIISKHLFQNPITNIFTNNYITLNNEKYNLKYVDKDDTLELIPIRGDIGYVTVTYDYKYYSDINYTQVSINNKQFDIFNFIPLTSDYSIVNNPKTVNSLSKIIVKNNNVLLSTPYFIGKVDFIDMFDWTMVQESDVTVFKGISKNTKKNLNYNVTVTFNNHDNTYIMKKNNSSFKYIHNQKLINQKLLDKFLVASDYFDIVMWSDTKTLQVELIDIDLVFTINDTKIIVNNSYEVIETSDIMLARLIINTPNLWLLQKNKINYLLMTQLLPILNNSTIIVDNCDAHFSKIIVRDNNELKFLYDIIEINDALSKPLITNSKIINYLIYSYSVFNNFDNVIELYNVYDSFLDNIIHLDIKHDTAIGKIIYNVINHNEMDENIYNKSPYSLSVKKTYNFSIPDIYEIFPNPYLNLLNSIKNNPSYNNHFHIYKIDDHFIDVYKSIVSYSIFRLSIPNLTIDDDADSHKNLTPNVRGVYNSNVVIYSVYLTFLYAFDLTEISNYEQENLEQHTKFTSKYDNHPKINTTKLQILPDFPKIRKKTQFFLWKLFYFPEKQFSNLSLTEFYLYGMCSNVKYIIQNKNYNLCDLIFNYIYNNVKSKITSDDAPVSDVLKYMCPFEILFQIITNLPVRKENLSLINELMKNVYPIDKSHERTVPILTNTYSMMMGTGKTKMVTPCTLLRSYYYNLLSSSRKVKNLFNVLPNHLVRQSHDYMTNKIQQFLGIPVIELEETNVCKMCSDILENGHPDPHNSCIYIISDNSLKCTFINNIKNIEKTANNNIFIFDEIDTILDPYTSELNYPANNIRLNNFSSYFDIIYNILYNIYKPHKDIKDILDQPDVNGEYSITPSFHVIKSGKLIELIQKYCLEEIKKTKLHPDIIECLVDRKKIKNFNNNHYKTMLYVLIMFIDLLIPRILSLVNRKDYGTYDVPDVNVIIPFKYVESPMIDSQFSNPLLIMCLTIVEHAIYNKMKYYSKERKYRYINILKLGVKSLPSNCIQSGLVYNEFMKNNLPISILTCNLNNISDEHMTKIFNNDVLTKIICFYICGNEIKYSKHQLNICGIDLMMSQYTPYKVGFTGTPSAYTIYDVQNKKFNSDNVLLTDLYEDDIDKSRSVTGMNIHKMKKYDYLTIANIIMRCNVDFTFNDEPIDILINNVINKYKSTDKIRAIIDIDGVIIGLNHIEIFNKIKSEINSITKLVYWDDKNNMSCYNGTNSTIFNENPYDETIFYYFDQQHTTGIDIKLPETCIGLAFVNGNTRFRNVSQGIYRLRKINSTQKIIFIGTKNYNDFITDTITKKCTGTSIKVNKNESFWMYIIFNELFNLKSNRNLLLIQNLRSLYRLCSTTGTYSIFALYNSFNFPPPRNFTNEFCISKTQLTDEMITNMITGKTTLTYIQDMCRMSDIKCIKNTYNFEKLVSEIKDFVESHYINYTTTSVNVQEQERINLQINQPKTLDQNNKFRTIIEYINSDSPNYYKIDSGTGISIWISILLELPHFDKLKPYFIYTDDKIFAITQFTGLKLSSVLRLSNIINCIITTFDGTTLYAPPATSYERSVRVKYVILICTDLFYGTSNFSINFMEFLIYNEDSLSNNIISNYLNVLQETKVTIKEFLTFINDTHMTNNIAYLRQLLIKYNEWYNTNPTDKNVTEFVQYSKVNYIDFYNHFVGIDTDDKFINFLKTITCDCSRKIINPLNDPYT